MNSPRPQSFSELVGWQPISTSAEHVHGTTVIALRYAEGCLMLADRRATMGNLIMYDQADKLGALDDKTLIAISGAFARAVDAIRMLQHSFKYYRRMFLTELSLEGKLQEISKSLSGNLTMEAGLYIPIVAAYDSSADDFNIYFFDAAGARFRAADYAAAGSGSERIRGIFEYISRTGKPWAQRKLDDVLADGLRMLDIASDLDSATGGFTKVLPGARVLTRTGTETISEDKIRSAAKKILNEAL